MSLYPPHAECDTCGGGIKSSAAWMCGECIQIAVELGIDLDGHSKPNDEDWRKIRNEIYRRQRAQTT